MIVGSFAIIVGLTAFLFAMIVSPDRPLFASRSCFVCKPLQVGVNTHEILIEFGLVLHRAIDGKDSDCQ